MIKQGLCSELVVDFAKNNTESLQNNLKKLCEVTGARLYAKLSSYCMHFENFSETFEIKPDDVVIEDGRIQVPRLKGFEEDDYDKGGFVVEVVLRLNNAYVECIHGRPSLEIGDYEEGEYDLLRAAEVEFGNRVRGWDGGSRHNYDRWLNESDRKTK